MDNREITRKDLKIQALLEKISILTTQYESQDADRRVTITELNQENEALREELRKYEEDAHVVEKEETTEKSSD